MTSGLRCAISSIDRRRRRRRAGGTRTGGRAATRASARLPSDAGREVVDDVDAPVLGEQPVDERRADEPGAAGHERLHRGTLPYVARSARHAAAARSGCRPAPSTPAPTIVSAASDTSGSSTASGPTTESRTLPPCDDADPVVQHRAVDSRAGLDDRAGAEDRRVHARARLDARARADQHRRLELGASGSIVDVALHPHARRDLACAGRRRARRAGRRARRRGPARYFSGVPMSSQ